MSDSPALWRMMRISSGLGPHAAVRMSELLGGAALCRNLISCEFRYSTESDNEFMKRVPACTILVITFLASANLGANSQCVVMTTAQAGDYALVVVLGRV